MCRFLSGFNPQRGYQPSGQPVDIWGCLPQRPDPACGVSGARIALVLQGRKGSLTQADICLFANRILLQSQCMLLNLLKNTVS